MNETIFELVPVFTSVINESTVNTIDARKLHAFLEIGKDFSTWIKNRIEQYGFTQDIDFIVFPNNGENSDGRPRIDYHVTLDMAKELSMVERNVKGKEARQYFIECEKRLRQQAKPLTPAEMILAQAKMLVDHERQLADMNRRLEAVEAVQPKPATHSTILGYCAAMNINVTAKQANALGRRAAGKCRIHGIPINHVHDDRFGAVNSYPHIVLDQIFQTNTASNVN